MVAFEKKVCFSRMLEKKFALWVIFSPPPINIKWPLPQEVCTGAASTNVWKYVVEKIDGNHTVPHQSISWAPCD